MIKELKAELAGAATLVVAFPALLLIASYGPQNVGVLAILGSLRVHLAVLLIAFSLVFFLFGRAFRGLFFAAFAAIVLGQIVITLAPHTASGTAGSDATQLRVLDFNILWDNPNGKQVADYILETAPDIAFIQESEAIEGEIERLSAVYPYRIGCGIAIRDCDTLLLSRYKLTDMAYIVVSGRMRQRVFGTSITVNGQKIELVAIHLTKAEFGRAQQNEYDYVSDYISKLDGPVITAGDFNTASWAPRLVEFLGKTGLKRAAIERATWPGGRALLNEFGLPIDHVLVKNAAITDLTIIPDSMGSNHRGQLATIAIPAAE